MLILKYYLSVAKKRIFMGNFYESLSNILGGFVPTSSQVSIIMIIKYKDYIADR